MANNVNEENAKYLSKLGMNGVNYTINDAWARAEIAEIETAIAGGVHFRGVTTTQITDGESAKDLTVNGEIIPVSNQNNGDMFIYYNGNNNLEFVVVDNGSTKTYSELGGTGTLGAMAYADTAAGSATVDIASAITFNPITPQVNKGTLSVSTTTGTGLTVTGVPTAASVTVSAPTATASAPTVTVSAPTITETHSTDTFDALTFTTYDEATATLTITTSTSSAFWTGAATITASAPTATASAPTITVGAPTVTVTYDKANGTTGTYIASASLSGDLSVTQSTPTATITNPTVTVTVSPVSD